MKKLFNILFTGKVLVNVSYRYINTQEVITTTCTSDGFLKLVELQGDNIEIISYKAAWLSRFFVCVHGRKFP